MHVGILGGTGPAGSALAVRLAAVGVDVTLGSRSKDRAASTCDQLRGRWPDHDLSLEPGENADAACAPLVVVATPWDAAPATAASVADALEGKVLVSMANALCRVGDELQPLVPPRGSVAAAVQAAVPGAHVVAAFHHVPARALADLVAPLSGDVLVCSDHPPAIEATSDLVRRVPGLRPVHAGRLANATPIEAFTAVLLHVNVHYRTRATIRVTGLGG